MVVCEALCVHCTVRTQYRSSVVGTKPNKPLILISIHNVYFAIEQDSFFAGKFLLSNDSHTICQQLFFLLRIIFFLFFGWIILNLKSLSTESPIDYLSFNECIIITFQRTVFIFDFICFSYNFFCVPPSHDWLYVRWRKKWRGINAINICRNNGGDFTVHVHVYSVWALSLFQYS